MKGISLLTLIMVMSIAKTQEDFNLVYQTKQSNCTIDSGELLVIWCPSNFEVHSYSKLMQSQGSSSYSGFYTQSLPILNPLSYTVLDGKAKISYVYNQNIYGLSFDATVNAFKVNSSETFSVASLIDGIQLDDIGIYKDSNEKQLYFRDRRRKENLSKLISISSQKINFKVKQNVNNTQIFDLLVCTKATSNGCQMHEVVTGVYPSQVQINQKSSITLPNNICGQNLILKDNFVVVSCPSFSNNAGQVQVYKRNGYDLSLIVTEIGTSQDYYNVGSSIELEQHNDNHATLFYTSTLVNDGKSYTFVNTIQIISFIQANGQTIYRTLITVNQFRQKTADSFSKGTSRLSIYSKNLLVTYDNLAKVYSMPVCSQNQFNDGQSCYDCDLKQFVSQFAQSYCEVCELASYSTDTFQSLVQLVYCNRMNEFDSSIYKQQSWKIYNPFVYGTDDLDTYPNNNSGGSGNNNTNNNETPSSNTTDNPDYNQNQTINNTDPQTGGELCDIDCINSKQPQSKAVSIKTIIIVVCIVGGIVLILIPVIAIICIVKKRKAKKLKQQQRRSETYQSDQKASTIPQKDEQQFERIQDKNDDKDDQNNDLQNKGSPPAKNKSLSIVFEDKEVLDLLTDEKEFFKFDNGSEDLRCSKKGSFKEKALHQSTHEDNIDGLMERNDSLDTEGIESENNENSLRCANRMDIKLDAKDEDDE